MITPNDIKAIKEIKKLISPLNICLSIDWEKDALIGTLDRVVNNLQIAKHSYRRADEDDIAHGFYTALCPKCGWWGSSKLLLGGGQIADTGDYDDCYCPVCGSSDLDEVPMEEDWMHGRGIKNAPLKLWKVEFEPMNPVGGCLIILAPDMDEADAIAARTITHTKVYTIEEVKNNKPGVVIYLSGDY